ncbi:MAG: hypothetical protein COA90_04705 [Gammaproteobacteria bacterium]|nr:MAG: hypothetical protein COA90_04705 [Gammaproteobacteria bacterium]
MAEMNEESVIETDTPEVSVGERLRSMREKKKLTLAEVASELRLLKENVEYLENGQWEKLHGRAYATGYFSSYVKLLGLPAAEMLQAFHREYKTEGSDLQPVRVAKAKAFPWFTVFFLLLLIGLAGTIYQQNNVLKLGQSSATEINQFASSPPKPSSADDSLAFVNSVVEPISETEAMLITTVDDTSQADELTSSVDEIEVVESDELIEDLRSTQLIIDENTANELNEEDVIEAAIPSFSVSFSFPQACWASVRDATGKLLLEKVMLANSNIILVGKAPLSVTLGHSQGVSVKVNNEVVDISSYSTGNVAKFKLGENF